MRSRSLVRATGLAVLLLFASCAAEHVTKVQSQIVGKKSSDIEQCLGIPSHTAELKNGMTLAEWDYNDKEVGTTVTTPSSSLAFLPLTLPLALAGSVAIDNSGSCKAIVTFQDDVVKHLIYAGADDSILGEDARCDAVVRGCFRYWDIKH